MTGKADDDDKLESKGGDGDGGEGKADAKNEGGEKSDGGSDSGGVSESDIRTLVREALDELFGEGDESAGKRSRSSDEDDIFDRVRAAQAKLKEEEEREGRFTKVEKALEKVFEKPPARDGFAGKLQRFLWGEE